MSLHAFDPDIAQRVGLNAAVIYQNFLFWCQKNKANKRHIRDGYVWTYNSRRALAELFPYLTDSQIKTAIAKLIEDGLLVKGDYNLASYDKTSWYAPTVSAHWLNSAIGEKSPMDWPENANGLAENRQPIPDSKPDDKPDGKHISAKADDRFAEFWACVPKKVGKGQAVKAWRSALKKTDAETIIAAMQEYARQREGQDAQYTAHPATWLNGERWADEAPQTQQDFYDQIQQHLSGGQQIALSGPDKNSGVDRNRVSALLSAPRPPRQRDGDAGNCRDSRGGKRPSADFIKPRRI